MVYQLTIQNSSGAFLPVVESGVVWQTTKYNAPSELTFTIVADSNAQVSEGDVVSLLVDNSPVFLGYVFAQRITGDGLVQITAYDQMRYLKNKDTYTYANMTATELIVMLANHFGLATGTLADTGYKIASRIEENTSLIDMIQNALEITMENTGMQYVLYDDYGKLSLCKLDELSTKVLIDAENTEDYTYTSSIDSDTYNKVRLIYSDKRSGVRQVYLAQSAETIAQWGVLQKVDSITEGENGFVKANELLALHNKKSHSLSISKTFGDISVRAGGTVVVSLDIGSGVENRILSVAKCSHIFGESEHFMDLELEF